METGQLSSMVCFFSYCFNGDFQQFQQFAIKKDPGTMSNYYRDPQGITHSMLRRWLRGLGIALFHHIFFYGEILGITILEYVIYGKVLLKV